MIDKVFDWIHQIGNLHRIVDLPRTQAINDLKKQLSTTDSIIFSSFVLIFGGPKKLGITMFSLYLKKKFNFQVFISIDLLQFRFEVMSTHFHRECLPPISLNCTNLKLFPMKCLDKWSIVSFSKNIFRLISVSGSFGTEGFGNNTIVIMLFFLVLLSHWTAATFDKWQVKEHKTQQQFKPFKGAWNYWKVKACYSLGMKPFKCLIGVRIV